ncbi:hypothetical protein RHS01_06754 [Rhizoctonia solani]|uniref:Uncharacterized protein n=1 Tax=Rhizoctonia solani TaxID=456999 RepID=A0A8H7I8T4_9AGAM|nr:hypothetical protein RHS01_06754 [Rhizoctonia solani]
MTKDSGGSGSSPDSGTGSGSSSGGSGETARPKAPQNPSQSITFTFSSRNSPFAHLSPPGSFTFVSNKRRGSEPSRDRPYRKQQSSQPSGWIALPPLKPVTEVSPLFEPLSSSNNTSLTRASKTNTAVFSSRSPNNARTSPRLSLMAQHHHATSPHPSFNTPPQLVTLPLRIHSESSGDQPTTATFLPCLHLKVGARVIGPNPRANHRNDRRKLFNPRSSSATRTFFVP